MTYKSLYVIVAFTIISSFSVLTAEAQTTYEDERGFFTPILESFYLRGGMIESTQQIGPAVGYRFNSNYDVTLHTELLSSVIKNANPDIDGPKMDLLNLGVVVGRTAPISNRFMVRSEASLYKSFNFNVENYSGLSEPSLNSFQVSSALYNRLPLTSSFSLLPNIGGFAGVGDYTPAYTSANLRQGYDGIVVGPKFGVDALFDLADSFSIAVKPLYRLRYNLTQDYTVGTLTLNFQLNF